MTSHKFRIGDRVRLVRQASTNTVEAFLNMVTTIDTTRPEDIWEVTRLLPADQAGFQYHVRGSHDGAARLVREEQLQPA
ncbi:hypothetical protein [Microvirga splendida]|uniref:Uncharacterized protein n=1 Tax=Microvirga splendida TaxID=2795727 RepID=A0ABS0XV75_9HYPH|nr:hypothetical protein [Microvirga splendida]MBJ6123956.1 hypothetical protein [Microvirga splendida]